MERKLNFEKDRRVAANEELDSAIAEKERFEKMVKKFCFFEHF